jgi:hypothetical protein
MNSTRVASPQTAAKPAFRLPPDFDKYLDPTPPNSYGTVYGDFEPCPLEPDTPGAMRRVRVASAEKLVVESVNGLRPPFRVMSTWPKPEQAAPRLPLSTERHLHDVRGHHAGTVHADRLHAPLRKRVDRGRVK